MSLRSWKEEFILPYNVYEDSLERLVEVGIKKWEGCFEENLERHRVVQVGNEVVVENELDFHHLCDCSLCDYAEYVSERKNSDYMCTECPIYLVTGNSCDGSVEDFVDDKPWQLAVDTVPNIIPMLDVLKDTLKGVSEQNLINEL